MLWKIRTWLANLRFLQQGDLAIRPNSKNYRNLKTTIKVAPNLQKTVDYCNAQIVSKKERQKHFKSDSTLDRKAVKKLSTQQNDKNVDELNELVMLSNCRSIVKNFCAA